MKQISIDWNRNRHSVYALAIYASAVLWNVVFSVEAQAQTYTVITLDYPDTSVIDTYANGINDNGDVVGYFTVNSGANIAKFSYIYKGGSYVQISERDSVGNSLETVANGINNSGSVVGYAYGIGAGCAYCGFVYSNGLFSSLPSIAGSSSFTPGAINNNGVIVGRFVDLFYAIGKGFVYDGTSYTVISDPNTLRFTSTWVGGINDNGIVVGGYTDAIGSHGFLYDGIAYTTIDNPYATSVSSSTVLSGVNNSGVIAGYYMDKASFTHGFLYSKGVYTPMELLNGQLVYVSGINNKGQVVGTYFNRGKHGFIATPNTASPPPASLVDPVPDLLSGPQITPNLTATNGQPYLADLTKGRNVTGLATDGVAQVVIRIPASAIGEQFTLAVRPDQCASLAASACIDEYGRVFNPANPPASVFNNTQGQTSTVVTAVSTAQGPMAFAAYRAPLDFVRSGTPNAADQTAAQRSVFVSINNGAKSDLQIKVVRPPVVLIHGNWSNPSSWNSFIPLSGSPNSSLNDSRFTIYRVNYYNTLLTGVNDSLPNILLQLVQFYQAFKDNNNVASVQSDVIGYSMGGLIARGMSKYQLFQAFYPFNKGGFHKLITLDTPHLGSEFAELTFKSSNFCKTLLFSASGNVVSQNIADLVPNSPFLMSLSINSSPNHLYTHAVVGIADAYQTQEAESKFIVKNSLLHIICPYILPSSGFAGVFSNHSNDLVVSDTSQSAFGSGLLGRIPTSSPSVPVVHTVNPSVYPVGPDVLGHDIINGKIETATETPQAIITNHVIDLLNQPVNGTSYAPIYP